MKPCKHPMVHPNGNCTLCGASATTTPGHCKIVPFPAPLCLLMDVMPRPVDGEYQEETKQ